jgi:glutamate formiminotransferase
VAEPIFGVVPNFSEGRRLDVMDAICDALQVPGAHLVYRQADADHNRLDTTVLGSRDGVHRASVSAARVAAGLIDMEHHRGGHPRMGATDVIPFMPVRDVDMAACIELAREVGAELAQALDLPVYLYDQAALVPERRSLAALSPADAEHIRLRGFDRQTQVLERLIEEAS